MNRSFIWLGLLFISTCLLFFIPIFLIPDYFIGSVFLIIGIFFISISFYKDKQKNINSKYLIFLLPIIFAVLLIPFPYNLSFIIIGVGVLLYFITNYIIKYDKANFIFFGISFSGLILTIQLAFLPFYAIVVSHGHRVDILSGFTSFISNLFGMKASVSNGLIYVKTLENTVPFTTTWEKLGLFPWLNIFIGMLVIFAFLPNIRKYAKLVLVFIIFSFFYLIMRYVFMIYIFTQLMDTNIFWDPIILVLSFIPFALILMKIIPIKDFKINLKPFKKFSLNKKRICATLLIFIFIFSLIGVFTYHDPGVEKQGRILIDEVHSDWENSLQVFDKEWYGMLSTYNYYNWAEWLDKYYDVYKNNNSYLRSDLLNNYDVLILKCPTDSYTVDEIEDIISFVKDGGGLYLIGDHTNVFGMNFYLNQVSENFGITFNSDANYELGTGLTSSYEPLDIFPHPVVQNVEKFQFLTSCTLKAPINSENVIIGNRVIAEPGTYSTENFFRVSINSPDLEFGYLLQVAALKYGKGRVLAFTDSTCFSNFCIFMDGYTDFNLGVVEYLNRENSFGFVNTIFIITMISSFALSLLLLKKEDKEFIIFIMIAISILSFSVAVPTFNYLNQVNYDLPEPKEDFISVGFDQEYSNAIIEHKVSLYSSGLENDFGTFFVWTQRLNCYPSIKKTLEDSIEESDIIVIINPIKSFNNKDIDSIIDYIKGGGKVLLMDSILNSHSTSNELLEKFDINIDYKTTYKEIFKLNKSFTNNSLKHIRDNSSIGNISQPYLSINGGNNLFVTKKNDTSIASLDYGKGKLVVLLDSYSFSDDIMGGTFTEPDEDLRRLYNIEYYVFEELLLDK